MSGSMSGPPLGTGPEKAQFVASMFSRIAGRYDLMNGLMTLGMHHAWRRAAARLTIAAPDGPARPACGASRRLALGPFRGVGRVGLFEPFLLDDLLEHWSKLLARPTPLGPKVDDHRHLPRPLDHIGRERRLLGRNNPGR